MTTATLHFDIDGDMVKSTDASWFIYAPCGCCSGVTIVDLGDSHLKHPYPVKATEQDAWEAFYERKDIRDRDQKLGYTIKLGKRTDVMELLNDCEHTPKWGHERTPIPEGHAWAKSYSGRRVHLVPTEHKNDNRATITAPDYRQLIAALCGAGEYSWDANEGIQHDYLECSKCTMAATVAA